MKWNIRHIPVEQLTGLIATFKAMVEAGDERLNNMRCIYTIDDTNITYTSTVFDFIDLNSLPSIKSFSLSQMVTT